MITYMLAVLVSVAITVGFYLLTWNLVPDYRIVVVLTIMIFGLQFYVIDMIADWYIKRMRDKR